MSTRSLRPTCLRFGFTMFANASLANRRFYAPSPWRRRLARLLGLAVVVTVAGAISASTPARAGAEPVITNWHGTYTLTVTSSGDNFQRTLTNSYRDYSDVSIPPRLSHDSYYTVTNQDANCGQLSGWEHSYLNGMSSVDVNGNPIPRIHNVSVNKDIGYLGISHMEFFMPTTDGFQEHCEFFSGTGWKITSEVSSVTYKWGSLGYYNTADPANVWISSDGNVVSATDADITGSDCPSPDLVTTFECKLTARFSRLLDTDADGWTDDDEVLNHQTDPWDSGSHPYGSPPPPLPPPPLPGTPIDPSVPDPTIREKVCGGGTGDAVAGIGAGNTIIETAHFGEILETPWIETVGKHASIPGLVLGAHGVYCAVTNTKGVDATTSQIFAQSACNALSTASFGTGILAMASAWNPVGWVSGAVSLAAGVGAAFACEADPPDPNFRKLAKPKRIKVTQGRPPRSTPRKAAKYGKDLMKNSATLLASGNVFLTSLNRSSGAAEAKNKRWEKRQRLHAAKYARKLSALYKRQITIRKNLVKALRRGGVKNKKFTQDQIAQALDKVAAADQGTLDKLGLASTDVKEISRVIGGKKPKMPKDLFDSIAGTKAIKALRSASAAFKRIAKDLEKRKVAF